MTALERSSPAWFGGGGSCIIGAESAAGVLPEGGRRNGVAVYKALILMALPRGFEPLFPP